MIGKILGRNRIVGKLGEAVEAGMIGFIGGVFGLIFGTLLGKLVDWIGHRYLINEGITGVGPLSVVPWWLALGAVAIMVTMPWKGHFWVAAFFLVAMPGGMRQPTFDCFLIVKS